MNEAELKAKMEEMARRNAAETRDLRKAGWWRNAFDKRELQEIDYCLVYMRPEFNHGTDGHLPRTLIAKLAKMLDEA